MNKFPSFLGLFFLFFVHSYSQPGCPNITVTASSSTVGCNNPCTNLNATVFPIGQTTSYSVSSIPFAPPYPICGGGTGVSVGTDDVWSPVINLPFPFCFFGNTYTQCLIGSNGVISFDVSQAGGYCPWSYSASCPNSALPNPAIFGVYEDIDPSLCGSVTYTVIGSVPCRMLVVNFCNMCYFSCGSSSGVANYSMVLYETTNVIEVYVQSAPGCPTWNSDNSLIGIQNTGGTFGYTPPGRNTGPWVASNEAWRFTPTGAPIYGNVQWYSPGPTLVGTGNTINVCPTANTTYTATTTYTRCDGFTVQVSAPVSITYLGSLNASVNSSSTTCYGSCNGSGTITPSGGTGPYSYTWSPSGGNASTASGLCAGTYTINISDASNCVITQTIAINQPSLLNVSITNTNINCYGGNNGSANASVSGGVGGYTYTWSPTGGNSATATGLTAGIYTIQVKDANNCGPISATVQITEPSALSITATQTQSVLCNGGNNGSASTSASGGVGGYTYTWSPTGGNSATATGLTAGVYTVQVKDANNCGPISATVQITEPPALSITATQTQSVLCNGGNNGSASASASGGVGGYTYTWSPTGGNSAASTGLTAGVYTVQVSDVNSCNLSTTVQITQPSDYTLAVTTQSAGCSTPGGATVTVNGAVLPYSYTWSPSGGNSNIATGLSPGTYTVTIQDANNCYTTAIANITGAPSVSISSVNTNTISCNGGSNGSATITALGGAIPYNYTWTPSISSTSIATGLSAGNYTVVVGDNNNCITSTVITINQPPALSLTATQIQSVLCNGGNNGSASASASGGVGGYTYTWSPSGGNSSTATGLTAGVYSVQISDANNCGPISDTVQIIEPLPLSLTATQTQSVLCNGGNTGSANASVSGGVGGYTYTWSPSGGNIATATGLTAGTYTIQVNDVNNCSISATVQIDEPPALSISVNGQSVSCYGYSDGSATVTVNGGVGGYSYTWAPSGGNANIASNLTANTYTINVLDANNCFISTSINITQPSSIALVTSPNQTICYGSSTNISANANGGNPPYTYNWSNGLPNSGGPHLITLTSTTIYTVQAIDANNCLSPINSIKITVLPPLLATGMQATVCDGQTANVYPTITSPGNGGPYAYSWSNGQSTATISVTGNYNLGSTNIYTVTISDNCSTPDAVAEITVNVNPNPVISFTAIPQKGCVPLAVTFEAYSDTTSDNYLWYFGNGESNTNSQSVTTYTQSGLYTPTLVVSNIYGCTTTSIAPNYIEVYPKPIADFDASTWTVSLLEPSVQFYNQSTGASSYTWNFGDYSNASNTSYEVNPIHDYLYSGTYTVILVAESDHGCIDYITKPLYVEPEFYIYIPDAFTPDGNGLNDVFQPKGIGIDESDYKMLIFDRWGELIYESNNFSKGWDGSVKGALNKAMQDVYVYKIYIRDLKGGKHEFVGHVTCLPYTGE